MPRMIIKGARQNCYGSSKQSIGKGFWSLTLYKAHSSILNYFELENSLEALSKLQLRQNFSLYKACWYILVPWNPYVSF